MIATDPKASSARRDGHRIIGSDSERPEVRENEYSLPLSRFQFHRESLQGRPSPHLYAPKMGEPRVITIRTRRSSSPTGGVLAAKVDGYSARFLVLVVFEQKTASHGPAAFSIFLTADLGGTDAAAKFLNCCDR